MRILLVTHFFPAHGGGVERVAEQLARQMRDLGHTVVWAASDTDAPVGADVAEPLPMRSFNGVERLTGFPYPLWSWDSLSRLAQAVRAADAVHVHDAIYVGSLAAAWMARRHRKPLIATQHIGDVPLPPLLRPALAIANRVGARAVLHGAAGVAFISPVVRAYFQALVGERPNFHFVPNGVDSDVFQRPHGPRGPLKAALGLDPTRPLLLFVGRFAPKKRLHLLRAMAAQAPEAWQWRVIGHGPAQGTDHPDTWGLAQVAAVSPLPHPQLAEYYRAADLLVLPSHGEGFPLVVQEAMACGLPPCITAEVASGADLPADLWLRLAPESGDIGLMAGAGVAAIEAWLQWPEAERLAQQARCAEYARAKWSWEQACQALLGWLQAPERQQL